MFFAPGVKFVFKQAALDFTVVKGYPSFRAQPHLFDHLQIAGENISTVAPVDTFKPVPATLVKRFQSLQSGESCVRVNLIGSFIMISLGIIGEYIAKIYEEVKARPPYLIRAELGPRSPERTARDPGD